MKQMELIAPCHFGMEAVLKREIIDLGYDISKVEDGKVTLTDENGTNKEATQTMWTLDEGDLVLTIKNTELYSLPSSGGPGIYGFTISGVAFITAALLLFINNKRKEDEAKFRSTH